MEIQVSVKQNMSGKIFFRGYRNIIEKSNQECKEADTRLKETAFQMIFG